MKIGIWGVSGFLGVELVKIFSKRPEVEVAYTVTSKEAKGTLTEVEVAFLALKAEQSLEVAPRLLDLGIRVVDLSGAFRIRNICDFDKYYNVKHHNRYLDIVVYGLPEKNRDKIRSARLVANPGCYATAVNLGLLPLSLNGLILPRTMILVRAVSGYSGAGRQAKIPNSILSYKPGRLHQHIPEIEQELKIINQLFLFPNVASWPRGIEVSIYLKLSDSPDIIDLYKQFYQNEAFVRIKDETKINNVIRTNFCDISPRMEKSIAIIKVAIDNIGKGGAGQAVQNFNIMCGFSEKYIY